MLAEKVTRTMRKHRMLSPGDRVVVAVSGGPDSVCLLHVLRETAGALALQLHVAHLDHGFRGAESAEEARFVGSTAASLGLPATIEHADVPRYCAERGLSAQTGAREVRYRFLERVARETGSRRIAVGHTANDQAETVIMRLVRGAGLSGLSGIRPVRGSVIRPLIEATRAEVLAHLRTHGISFRTDPSNSSPAHTRNRVRTEIIPVLERFNPRIIETLASESALFREADEALEAAAAASLARPGPGGTLRIDRDPFLALPAGLQKYVLRRAVEEMEGGGRVLSSVQTEDALAFLRTSASGRVLELPFGLRLEREYGSFLLHAGTAAAPFDHPVAVPGRTSVPGLALEVETAVHGPAADGPEPGNYLWQAVFDYDKITLPLHLRSRLPGDRFQPAGMGGHRKKLQDFLLDSKVPRSERDRVPLLSTAADILWVVGMRSDGRFLPGPSTGRLLTVTVRRMP